MGDAVALPEVAQAFDADGNGVLDGVEVAAMLEAMGETADASKQRQQALATAADAARGRPSAARGSAEVIARLYDSRWPATAVPAPGPAPVMALQPASPQVTRLQSPPSSPAAAAQSAHAKRTASPSDQFVHGLIERAAVRPARESLGQLEQRIRTSSVPGPSVPSPVTSLHSTSGAPPATAEATPPVEPLPVEEAVTARTTECVTRRRPSHPRPGLLAC
jgi:hypothetical protein